MERVTCSYCGLPFKIHHVTPDRAVYCCSGCAVADRIPRGGGDWPMTVELGLACAAGFLFFNQILIGVLGSLMRGEGRLELADHLAWTRLGGAVVVWLVLFALQRRSGAKRRVDGLVLAATGLTLLVAGISGNAWCAAGANAGLLLWAGRGWFRRPRAGSD